jgi:hypothetical protein
MNKKEEEIQRKLLELESTVLKEQTDIITGGGRSNMTAKGGKAGGKLNSGGYGTSSSGDTAPLNKSDGFYFGGMALILLGLFMVFTHVRVGNGFLQMLMGGGGGLVFFLLPLLAGIGMMVYDSNNKWGRIITGLSCVMLLLAILFTLNFTFPSLTLMQTLLMFLPFAIGGAFVVKGMGGPAGIKDAVKAQLPKREDA